MNDHGQGGWGPRPPPTTQPGSPSWAVSPYDPPQQPAPYGQPPGHAIQPYPLVHQPQYGYQPQYAPVPSDGVPTAYKNIGILMLISGVKGLLVSFALFVTLILACASARSGSSRCRSRSWRSSSAR